MSWWIGKAVMYQMNEVQKFNCDHVTMACHTGMFVQYLLKLRNKLVIKYFWFEFSVRIRVIVGPCKRRLNGAVLSMRL